MSARPDRRPTRRHSPLLHLSVLVVLTTGAGLSAQCGDGRQPPASQATAAESATYGAHLAQASRAAAHHRDPKRTLTVLSYNVNYKRRRASTVNAIESLDADVVCLQETTPAWEITLRLALASRYKHMTFHHSRGAGGLAVLSRYPFKTRRIIPSSVGKFPAWQLLVKSPLGVVQIFNLHLRPIFWRGSDDVISRYYRTQKIRLRETRTILPHIDPKLPTVLLGDFNEDIAGRSLKLLIGRGYKSAARHLAPSTPTWRWRVRGREIRWQLDHVLHGPRLQTRHFRVVEAGASDHFPLIAVLAPAR